MPCLRGMRVNQPTDSTPSRMSTPVRCRNGFTRSTPGWADRQEHVPHQPECSGRAFSARSSPRSISSPIRRGSSSAAVAPDAWTRVRPTRSSNGSARFRALPVASDDRRIADAPGVSRGHRHPGMAWSICQEVCPYNQPAPTSGDTPWQPRAGLDLAAPRRSGTPIGR